MKPKFSSISTVAFLFILISTTASCASGPHVNASEVEWRSTFTDYGPEFAKAFRFRTLVGEQSAPVQAPNIYFGEAEWAPGAIYVGHKHKAPEIYYVISGKAKWTVGEETFIATDGTAIYTKPDTLHRMENIGDGILRTVWIWWGKPSVTGQPSLRVEPLAIQPKTAVFPE